MFDSTPRNRAVICKTTFWIPTTLICLGICAAGWALARARGPGDLQAYTLRHVPVAQIEQTLATLLPPGTEVKSDVARNSVWIRGSSQTHQLAQATIDSLDRPAAVLAAQEPSAPGQPILKGYPVKPGEAAGLVTRWNTQFGTLPGVRIVFDQRTSQVLVMGPPEVHATITQSGEPTSAAAPTAASSPSQPAAGPGLPPSPQAPGSREVVLEKSTGERMEATLLDLLGHRLQPAQNSAPGMAAYHLQLADGRALSLTLDGRTHRVRLEGPPAAARSCARMIELLDAARLSPGDVTRLVPLSATRPADLDRTVQAIRAGNLSARPASRQRATRMQGHGSLVSLIYQQSDPSSTGSSQGASDDSQTPGGGAAQPARPQAGAPLAPPAADEQGGALIGPVQIEVIEGLNRLLIRGPKRDVQRVIEMIEQIEELSLEAEPSIEVYHLRHVECRALAALANQLYADVFSVRLGTVSITALVKPNALLLIGRPANVETVLNLVKQLDRPVLPETQFQVFRLQHASATQVQTLVQEFYEVEDDDELSLAPRVRVTADVRSNSLVVQASPRDLAEVAEMIARLDTGTSPAVNELQLIQLDNSLAEELAETLLAAIGGAAGESDEQRSTTLRFVTVDTEGRQQFSSGILSDVRITPDARANTLLVSAPAESMPLLEALIRQLDQLPAAEAQIKVFTIVNSDASSMMEMLETLFGEQAAEGEPAVQTAAVDEESSLVPLRFAVDERTNSIIASGTIGDLCVVEAILLRLDETDIRLRESIVYRLKNAPANDVATAVNEYLDTLEQRVEQITTDLMSPFEQVERKVVLVAEPVSNSLIVSASPEYFDEIMQIVEELDARPPMVMIQVLIAEVRLNDTDEFGVEVGLQDSILFDRSLLGDIQTTSSTVFDAVTGLPVASTDIIQSATNTPGFLFNNQQLGNSGAAAASQNSNQLGTQGLAHFDIGRINDDLGYGGFVLSASSESISLLLRALKENRRLEVLSRPQIMTMDNQPAFILVGERVPRVTGTVTNQAGQTNTIALEDVGLILGVTPRISPDGLVVMEIDATNSALGTEAEGIPISIAPNGDTIRSPRINTIQAQTTISAMDGQTVVLGGLITKTTNEVDRRVPLLSNIPVIGHLFRYELHEDARNELLIIMTPHIVQSEEDAELIKQMEVARMHWCLGDVLELGGEGNLRGRTDEWHDGETTVIYPDGNPRMKAAPSMEDLPEPAPVPADSPFLLEPDTNPVRSR